MLSQPQFNEMADTTKVGAMPIKTNFDGPGPIKLPNTQGIMQPNQSVELPKPGFF